MTAEQEKYRQERAARIANCDHMWVPVYGSPGVSTPGVKVCPKCDAKSVPISPFVMP